MEVTGSASEIATKLILGRLLREPDRKSGLGATSWLEDEENRLIKDAAAAKGDGKDGDALKDSVLCFIDEVFQIADGRSQSAPSKAQSRSALTFSSTTDRQRG